MTKKMYVLLCAMLVFLCVDGTSIKGLYCKDPDTGNLHPVNSTWQSVTFCGNYTCKLRKKSSTQNYYRSIPTINITADNLRNNEYTSDDMSTSPSQQSVNVINNLEVKQSDFQKDLISRVNELTSESSNDIMKNKDRYLTESEIKTITEMLHAVKKSDLEAIVEIYNLAQDIYKEMDITTTTEKLVEETKHNNIADKNEVKAKLKSNSQESVSYWYEPLHHHNSKTNRPKDSKIDETNQTPSMQSYPHPASYFKGPLTEKDFGKLPYYYPLSNFQRMSSYLHNRSPHALPPYVPAPSDHRPCNKRLNKIVPQSWYGQQIPPKKIYPEIHNRPRPMQSMLLPYPFSYVNHNNFSSYPASFYYSNYPWAQLDMYNRHRNNPQLHYGAYPPQMPKTDIIVNTEELEDKIEDTNNVVDDDKADFFESEENKKLPDWQTEQLSTNILEEVKANILEKSKLLQPLSLRKNIKLEKVGKVIKLDELLRSKRDLSVRHKEINNTENSLYEAYIERKTCESSFEPGFFRVGNETEPFPACCPQMIKTDDNNK